MIFCVPPDIANELNDFHVIPIKVCQKHSLSILAAYVSDYVIVVWVFLMDFEDFSDVAEMKKI